jgi:hypothetical protein
MNTQHKSKKCVKFSNLNVTFFFIDCEDRKSYWVINRCHFQRHCLKIQNTISFVFEHEHRKKIRKLIHYWSSFDPGI